ncbi:MFS transporter [Tunturibacter empetritectus]|uniref:DHA1 family inner membrane transport protein n=1 Tax=Tunturiibacter empetritectus TaxID=3069691 RepID=A0A7W8IK29_9BACT|nr:MFS transporter [Edaphobacter lichenicola]MBB5317663.1 DHA1 family inner membrane transport protein [Edaphobacter lichenicola]
MPASEASSVTTAERKNILLHTPLMALAVAAFGIGTSEFIIMGLLPNLADDFHVSIPRAGVLVTGYALSVTIGAPIVAIATARLERKLALLLLMGVFTLGNLACAVAPTYNLLFAARVLTALCHGAFFGIGSVVAANLVPRNQRAQAIALMFSGLTLANVLGVPAGTALGQAYGWRFAFWAIVPIGLIAAIAVFFLVPKQAAGSGSLLHEFRVLRKPQVLLVLAMSILTSASLFCVFTYIAPTLEAVTLVSPHAVTLTLLLFGVGITVGNFLGGTLSDWRPMAFLIGALLTLLASLLALYYAEPHVIPAIVMILIWGAIQFAAGAPLQSRIVDQAAAAPNLASTLNQGAFNFGNATGASLGGMMLTAGYTYRQLPLASIIVTLITLILAILSARLDRKHRDARIAEQLSVL